MEVGAFAEDLMEEIVQAIYGDNGSFPTPRLHLPRRNFFREEEIGRDDRIRTCDPLTPRKVRTIVASDQFTDDRGFSSLSA